MKSNYSADTLHHAVGGNAQLAQRVAEAFLRVRPELEARLTAAVHSRDSAAAKRAAHELRGMAGMMGAAQLAQTATALEAHALKPGADLTSDEVADLLRDLTEEWDGVARNLSPLAPHLS